MCDLGEGARVLICRFVGACARSRVLGCVGGATHGSSATKLYVHVHPPLRRRLPLPFVVVGVEGGVEGRVVQQSVRIV